MEDVYKIRKELAEIVGDLEDDSEDNERYINMTECDVTGSLGVWGINENGIIYKTNCR